MVFRWEKYCFTNKNYKADFPNTYPWMEDLQIISSSTRDTAPKGTIAAPPKELTFLFLNIFISGRASVGLKHCERLIWCRAWLRGCYEQHAKPILFSRKSDRFYSQWKAGFEEATFCTLAAQEVPAREPPSPSPTDARTPVSVPSSSASRCSLCATLRKGLPDTSSEPTPAWPWAQENVAAVQHPWTHFLAPCADFPQGLHLPWS